jgi:O-glycosyl hydrolase
MATKAAAKADGKANGRTQQPTEYTVLEQVALKNDQGDAVVAWVEAGTATATIRHNAVTEIAKGREGVWRAVPTRNWAEALRTREEITKKLKVEPVEPF